MILATFVIFTNGSFVADEDDVERVANSRKRLEVKTTFGVLLQTGSFFRSDLVAIGQAFCARLPLVELFLDILAFDTRYRD
jgi:ABC-type transporter Mla maintaining outer membrane lipid asymmetry ATPase subunit MlaF